ncbi:gp436 family protein [Idiomarina xiamenensis]|uniref:DUF1320 domain-containing protein n=1 Tax=Idiomarina xiamenensis 10-D-4 TaxID=740709 RepID=K2JYQ8_9GAMM|nr:phage protein Gp36 family protein [Idiomarina xiamenensis]EKE79717.1 hypothetical protein A10D4_12694 [Idiomarina xiamenensis 10-D-4]
MPYAAIGHLEIRFGVDELEQLAPTADEGESLDSDKLEAALTEATAEMDTFIAVAYSLPLASTPAFLVTVCCDIARFRLWDDSASDEVRKRYEDAISWLRRLAKGEVNLGLPTQEGGSRPQVAVKRTAADRVFTRESLKGF